MNNRKQVMVTKVLTLVCAGGMLLGLAACASPATKMPPRTQSVVSSADGASSGSGLGPIVESADVAAASRLIGLDWPAGHDSISTTDGAIYVDNLNSQIRVLDHRLVTQQEAAVRVMLAGLLYNRFQLFGRVEDAVKACEVLQQAMDENLLHADELLVFAKILSGLHQFDKAEQVIAAAAEQGGKPASIERARANVLASRRLPAQVEISEVPADYVSAVQKAASLLEQGKLYEASQQLRVAQGLYQDSNPFPLAWIHLQQGVAFLRYEQYEQARVFFAAAHERLPQYYLATEHLAETEALMGNWQRSAELYRQVSAQTDQPAFWHGLQQAESALGRQDDAYKAAQLADQNYQTLLEDHALTFADHAVSYYLDTGRAQRALELAELNFSNRQDVTAHLALAEALAANGQQKLACARVEAILEAGLSPPEILLPDSSFATCMPGENP